MYLWILYICLLQYDHALNTICSLVRLYIGNLISYISFTWVGMPFPTYSLTCILKKWINITLLVLVVTCIETHIFVPSFSISHLFFSTTNVFYCLLILGKLFNLNIQHSKTCIQHCLYTKFEEISSFSYFIFIYTWLQCVMLTTKESF